MKIQPPFQDTFVMTQAFGETITNPNGHTGLDYGLPIGTAVLAAAEGTVVKVANDPKGYGLHIILEHQSGLQTLYAHLSRCAAWKGQSMRAGELLGRSGTSGNSTGPHLHFEVRLEGKPIDPLPLLTASNVQIPPQQAAAASKANKKWKVSCEMLNIRSGPGIGAPIIGRIREGTAVPELAVVETRWIRIADGEWVAAIYNGQSLMAPD